MTSRVYLKLSFLCLLLFFIISYLVKINFFYNFDYSTTYFIQNRLGSFLNLPFSVFSIIGSFEVTTLIWVCLFIYFILKKNYQTALASVLFFAGLLTEIFGKLQIYHKQPPLALYRGVLDLPFPSSLVTQAITDNSYPSGHILRTTFLIVVLYYLIKQSNFKYKKLLNICLIIFLIFMFISRVYLGEHWVSDTIGGLLLGASLGLICVSSLKIQKYNKGS